MNHPFHFYWLLSFFLWTGCRREEPEATGTATSNPATDIASALATPTAARTNFSVPFRGVIKAREQRDLLLNSAEITYTISNGKIRREAVRTAPLGQLADMGQGVAGVICDLEAEEVVLYRSHQSKKRFVRMTLAQYQGLVTPIADTSEVTIDGGLFRMALGPAVTKHVGTFFVEIASPVPEGQAVNVPEARAVGDLPCDLLTIRQGETVFEVSHTQLVRVDRQLLELVELRLPVEVTGFPCLMRRLHQVPVEPADPSASTSRQLFQKGVSWAADVTEKAMLREIQLVQIEESIPPDSAFALGDSFVECPTLDELHRLFLPAEGHHDDWD